MSLVIILQILKMGETGEKDEQEDTVTAVKDEGEIQVLTPKELKLSKTDGTASDEVEDSERNDDKKHE